jgi:thioredoxin reductase (NADPH)
VVRLEDDHEITARTVLLATGAQYRRLPVDGLSDYEGLSVFYAARLPSGWLAAARW